MKTFRDCRGNRWSVPENDDHDYRICSVGSFYRQAMESGMADSKRTIFFFDPWTHWSLAGECSSLAPDPRLEVFYSPGIKSYGFPWGFGHLKKFLKFMEAHLKLQPESAGVIIDNHAADHPWWLTAGTDPEVYDKMHLGPRWWRRLLMLWFEGKIRKLFAGKVVLFNGPPISEKSCRWWETSCRSEWHSRQAADAMADDKKRGDWFWCNSGSMEHWTLFCRKAFGGSYPAERVIGCGYPDGDNTPGPSKETLRGLIDEG